MFLLYYQYKVSWKSILQFKIKIENDGRRVDLAGYVYGLGRNITPIV